MTFRLESIVGALLVCVAAGGCQTAHDPAKTWESELQLRREGAARSASLYRQGMDAYEADDLDGARSLLTQAVAASNSNAHARVSSAISASMATPSSRVPWQ